MFLSPSKTPGCNSLNPPNTFTSPVDSVFSSASEKGTLTNPGTVSEVYSPGIYDALPVSLFQDDPSRTVHSRSRRTGLSRLITGSTPAFTSFWDHPAIQDNLSIKLFSDRTSHLHNIFRLSADRLKSISSASINELIRLATWWFIHGQIQLNAVIRDISLVPSQQSETRFLIQQSQTNISKALWILQETFSQSSQYSSIENAARLRDYQHLLLSKICGTINSMTEYGLLPEDNSEVVFSPGSDGSIWVEYPSLGVEISFLLTGHMPSTVDNDHFDTKVLDHMPLQDSDGRFYYKALPVDVYLFNESSNGQQIKYYALLSVVRAREDSQISMVLASQDGQFNVCVKPEKELKSTWDNVTWLESISSLEVKLSTGFHLQIRCEISDFETLNQMYQHYKTANTLFERGIEEQLIFQTDIKSVECRLTMNENPNRFTDTAYQCRLRLFNRVIIRAEGTGPRKMHRGSRLVIATPTTSKNLSVLEYDIWPDQVIEYRFFERKNEQPAIFFRIDRNDPLAVTVLTFSSEDIFADVQLNGFSLAVGLEILGQSGMLGSSSWQRARIINSKPWHESGPDFESSTTVLSDTLRIILDSPHARFTDRLNLSIGELQIRRNVVAAGHVLNMAKEDHNDPTKTLSALKAQPSVRTFNFPSLFELHQFQAAITGFSVLFDSTPASFSISRRRLLVLKSKEWKSSHTRIQLLRRKETF
ncbi:hypothetical protein DL95DRAFT_471124 [Leptodontidium sp. 2 PMI_412]|nr:hypothetical protein DL95DRAFT_471124 [Leptodontidium sp. 2 PMI_412]